MLIVEQSVPLWSRNCWPEGRSTHATRQENRFVGKTKNRKNEGNDTAEPSPATDGICGSQTKGFNLGPEDLDHGDRRERNRVRRK
jgi:hypothetical protein